MNEQKKCLYINACVRENSRTNELATRLLKKLGDYQEVNLPTEHIQPLNRETLNLRTNLTASGDFSHEIFRYAKDFAQAETIVIAAPYWDMGFPALLKCYLEHIYCIGIVTDYSETGRPVGLCKAKKLYYVTTAGGPFSPEFSYDYISKLCEMIFGIHDVELIMAEMLDVQGVDTEKILKDTYDKYNLEG